MLNRIWCHILNDCRDRILHDAVYDRGEFRNVQENIWAGIRDNGRNWRGGIAQQMMLSRSIISYFYMN